MFRPGDKSLTLKITLQLLWNECLVAILNPDSPGAVSRGIFRHESQIVSADIWFCGFCDSARYPQVTKRSSIQIPRANVPHRFFADVSKDCRISYLPGENRKATNSGAFGKWQNHSAELISTYRGQRGRERHAGFPIHVRVGRVPKSRCLVNTFATHWFLSLSLSLYSCWRLQCNPRNLSTKDMYASFIQFLM